MLLLVILYPLPERKWSVNEYDNLSHFSTIQPLIKEIDAAMQAESRGADLCLQVLGRMMVAKNYCTYLLDSIP